MDKKGSSKLFRLTMITVLNKMNAKQPKTIVKLTIDIIEDPSQNSMEETKWQIQN